MRILRDVSSCPTECKGAVVALGNFDGVHMGHRAILQHTIELAAKEGAPAAVMTFEPHPREFFARGDNRLRIYPLRRKAELLAALGIDLLFIARFNRRFASLSAQAFVEDILHQGLAAKHVITGYNFAFGKNRQGDTDFLSRTAAQLGFGFSAHRPVRTPQEEEISSSAIRALLASGNMEKAALLLGAPYCIEGRVVKGEQRGRALGVPTANIALTKLFKPRLGVYAVRFQLGGEPRWHKGVASIGVKPTFGEHQPLLEVHGFDMERDMYGECMRVEPVAFIRDEERFDSITALCARMEEDCKKAKTLLSI